MCEKCFAGSLKDQVRLKSLLRAFRKTSEHSLIVFAFFHHHLIPTSTLSFAEFPCYCSSLAKCVTFRFQKKKKNCFVGVEINGIHVIEKIKLSVKFPKKKVSPQVCKLDGEYSIRFDGQICILCIIRNSFCKFALWKRDICVYAYMSVCLFGNFNLKLKSRNMMDIKYTKFHKSFYISIIKNEI